MELVAFLGADTENWGQVTALLNRWEWERIVLVQRKGTEKFPKHEHVEIIEIDSEKPIMEMQEILKEKLKSKLSGDFEVSLSLASGNGKEHMALLSALLNAPVGVKIVVFTKKGLEFLS